MTSAEDDLKKIHQTTVVVGGADTDYGRKVHWFRSTIFQILVVGGVFFCVCPPVRMFWMSSPLFRLLYVQMHAVYDFVLRCYV
jgi:hypothetical protein